MTAYEKLKQYEQQYHELNEESIELRNCRIVMRHSGLIY